MSSEVLTKFELELNQFQFRGIPLGSLIPTPLNIDFLYGQFDPKRHFRERLLYYYINYFPKRNIKGFDFKQHEKGIGLPMLTFISDRRHLFNMSYRIYEELGTDNVFCLLENENVYKKMDIPPVHYSFFEALPRYQFSVWRKEFSLIWKKIKPTILRFITENNVCIKYLLRIKNHLLSETRFIISCEILLKFLKPEFVLTEFDRYSFCAALIQVANRICTPTYTMMHGVVSNSIGYTPILANKLFAWGERHKFSLMGYGAREDQIVITGAPQLDNRKIGLKDQLLASLNLPLDSKIIVLATNPIRDELRLKLFQIFCVALDELAAYGFWGVLKIHPSEQLSFYKSVSNIPENVILDEEHIVGFEESLAIADLVCNYNSAYALDALIRNIPVITINIDEAFLGQASDFVSFGQLPAVKSPEELISTITKYFNNSEFRDLLLSRSENYTSKYCYAFGKEAAKNIINAIENGAYNNR